MVWNSNIPSVSLLKNTNTIATILSVFGSLWASYYSARTLSASNTSIKFIFVITLSDLLFSIANLMSIFEPEIENSVLCHIEAIIRQSSWKISLFFSSALAVFCYKSCSGGYDFNQGRFFNACLIIAFSLCLITTILPLFSDFVEYQNSDLYCQITYPRDASFHHRMTVRLFYVGLPTLLGTIISFGAYIKTIREFRKISMEGSGNIGSVSHYKLFWYPVVMFVTFTPCFIYSYTTAYFQITENITIKTIHLSLTHSIGFTNAILYGVQLKQSVGKFNRQRLTQERLFGESPRTSIYNNQFM